MNKSVILGLSGGLDSATLCAYYLDKGYQVLPVSFLYGSKHNIYEMTAAKELERHYSLHIQDVNLGFIGELFKSDLLKSGGEVPDGYYTDSNMSKTVVPARNVIFISVMMGYAWSVDAAIVALGVHSGDHAIYEDCRAGFVAAMNAAVIQGSGDRVHVEAPFQYIDKTAILRIGKRLGVPYHLTRTCYKDNPISCGKCGSCQERLEAFNAIGEEDPISYQ